MTNYAFSISCAKKSMYGFTAVYKSVIRAGLTLVIWSEPYFLKKKNTTFLKLIFLIPIT